MDKSRFRRQIVPSAAATLVCLLGSGEPIKAQGSQADTTAATWKMEGGLDFGFRWADSNGNEDKYFEDWNYRTGPRLFNMDITVTPSVPGVVDQFSVTAVNLGGDPYATLGFALRKVGAYRFRYNRRSSKYFYRDIILPHDDASIEASSGGDFHTFDFDRVNDEYFFDVNVRPNASVFVQFNRQTRIGASTTTLDVSRDEFELDRPLSEEKNDYLAGFKVSLDRLAIYFDQSYRNYMNDGRMFLPGASLGENPEGSTELFSFEQRLPFDFTMPQSTLRLNASPSSRLRVSAAFVASTLNGEFEYEELSRGVAFNNLPLEESIEGEGSVERSSRLADIDIDYRVAARLSVLGGVRLRHFDQQGNLRLESAPILSDFELSSQHVEIGARVHPLDNLDNLSLTAGARFESRDVTLGGALGSDPEANTQRTTGFVNATMKPTSQLFVLGEYERGNYDNPFTLISPTSQDRIKARVRYRGPRGISVVAALLHRRLNNALSDFSSDATSLTSQLTYQNDTLSLFGGLSRQTLDHEIMNIIRTAPGFQGGQSFELESAYESRIDSVNGGGKVTLTENLDVGADVNIYRNRGTFGVDWKYLRLFSDISLPAGYVMRWSYQHSSYGESLFDFDDYSANIVTVSFGYRF